MNENKLSFIQKLYFLLVRAILLSSWVIQEPLAISKDFPILYVLPHLERVILSFHFYIHLLFLSSSPNF